MMLLAVGIGGFFGAITRYALDGWLTGLAVANIGGSVLLGLVAVVAGLALGRLI